MTADRLNRWLTLGANLGVLVGLALLILEIDQNSDLVRVQIEQARSESYVNWLRQSADSEHIPPIYAQMDEMEGTFMERLKLLEPVDRVRLILTLEARYYDYENLHSQYQEGFFGEEYWEQRIVPAIAEWAPRWIEINPPDGPSGRQAFKDEVRRILDEAQ